MLSLMLLKTFKRQTLIVMLLTTSTGLSNSSQRGLTIMILKMSTFSKFLKKLLELWRSKTSKCQSKRTSSASLWIQSTLLVILGLIKSQIRIFTLKTPLLNSSTMGRSLSKIRRIESQFMILILLTHKVLCLKMSFTINIMETMTIHTPERQLNPLSTIPGMFWTKTQPLRLNLPIPSTTGIMVLTLLKIKQCTQETHHRDGSTMGTPAFKSSPQTSTLSWAWTSSLLLSY